MSCLIMKKIFYETWHVTFSLWWKGFIYVFFYLGLILSGLMCMLSLLPLEQFSQNHMKKHTRSAHTHTLRLLRWEIWCAAAARIRTRWEWEDIACVNCCFFIHILLFLSFFFIVVASLRLFCVYYIPFCLVFLCGLLLMAFAKQWERCWCAW